MACCGHRDARVVDYLSYRCNSRRSLGYGRVSAQSNSHRCGLTASAEAADDQDWLATAGSDTTPNAISHNLVAVTRYADERQIVSVLTCIDGCAAANDASVSDNCDSNNGRWRPKRVCNSATIFAPGLIWPNAQYDWANRTRAGWSKSRWIPR